MVKRRALSLLSRRVCPDRPPAAATRRTNASTRWDSLWRALPFKKKKKFKKKNFKKKGGPRDTPQSTLRLNNHHIRLWHPEKQKNKKKKPSFFFLVFGLAPTTLLHGGRRESKHGGGLFGVLVQKKTLQVYIGSLPCLSICPHIPWGWLL